MRRRMVGWLLCGMALVAWRGVSAAPDFYRAVGTPPDQVFRNGFAPWGTNENLVEHVAGTSCNQPRPGEEGRHGSAYVSLAATREAAMRVVRGRLEKLRTFHPQAVRWVYDVRPTPAVYNVRLTFERADVPLHEGPLRAVYQNAIYYAEWVNRGPVAPETIRAARAYRLVNGEVVEVPGSAVVNALYVEADTQANAQPLPPSVVLETNIGLAARGRALIGAAATGLVSACWCERPDDAGGTARSASAESDCADILQVNRVAPSLAHFLQLGWRVDP